MRKYQCSNCGALHDGNAILPIVLAKNGFLPVEVEEKPKELPKEERKPKFLQKPKAEEEDEDLRLEE